MCRLPNDRNPQALYVRNDSGINNLTLMSVKVKYIIKADTASPMIVELREKLADRKEQLVAAHTADPKSPFD